MTRMDIFSFVIDGRASATPKSRIATPDCLDIIGYTVSSSDVDV